MKNFMHKLIKSNNVVNIYLLSHYYKGTQIDFAYTDQTFCAKLFLKTAETHIVSALLELWLVGNLANMKIAIAIRY